ncbi:hypothetical protein ABZV52_29875 [Streptomyces sp. NPDC004735]|uniref:hypothetical protein n=1 Tax=Streptomyces sp. NPDC004735 TaxID=3156654 RepID=UPI0033B1B76C
MSVEAAGAARRSAAWATKAETAHGAAEAKRERADRHVGSRDPVQQAHAALCLSQASAYEKDRDACMGMANMWAAVSGALLNAVPADEKEEA